MPPCGGVNELARRGVPVPAGDPGSLDGLSAAPAGPAGPELGKADRRLVEQFLRCVTLTERAVVELRFGLRDGRPRTREEVGAALRITGPAARRYERQALA